MAKFKICAMIVGDVRQSIFDSMNNSFNSYTRRKYNHYDDDDYIIKMLVMEMKRMTMKIA